MLGRVIDGGTGQTVASAVPLLPPPEPATPDQPPAARSPLPPPSPGCFFLGARSFTIPFTVEEAGAQPTEVQLFASRGSASRWRRIDAKPAATEVKEFQYNAHEDGEFWFATRTLDAVGRAHPNRPIAAQLKVFVDTRKPEVRLDAEADASGRVDVVVTMSDSTPVTHQLRYVTNAVRAWQNVDVRSLPADGRVHFTPKDSWEQLSLQLIVTDAAKNQSVVSKLIGRPRIAASPGTRFAADGGQHAETNSAQFRIDSPQANVITVADPVIKLDRHRPTTSNPSVAPGYAPPSGSSALGGYRGAVPPATRYSGGTAFNAWQPPTIAAASPTAASPPPASPTAASPTAASPTAASPPPASPPAANPTAARLPVTSSPQVSGSFGQVPFGPPTIQKAPAWQLVQDRAQKFAPENRKATDQEASDGNGFGLNGPLQITPLPKTLPTTDADGKSRPRTAAEAMRPLLPETSEATANRAAVETIPTPEATPEHEAIPTPSGEPETKPVPTKTIRREANKAINYDTSGRAPVRFSDSQRFSLEYELESIGNTGIDSIELYGSTDDGKTWKFWGKDPDQKSPFDIETKEQGAFGFRIVVVGRNGLTSPRPLPGETPDIVVVVDRTAPVVRISGARYGEGDRTGALVIRYECQDDHLTERPVTLAFSNSVDGPWTTIAAGLRNDGGYLWPADPGLPRQFYLRMDAKDRAGNVGTYILNRAIDAQGLAPRARIRGFKSLTGSDSEDSDQKTANRRLDLLK